MCRMAYSDQGSIRGSTKGICSRGSPTLPGLTINALPYLALDNRNRCIYTHSMSPPPDLIETKDCLCLAARRGARAITRLYEERLRPHGLRATQFSILAALGLKGPTPMNELAELLGVEHSTLTRSTALLERNGWVLPGHPEDAREHLLVLTPAGRSKLEAALPAWKEAQVLAAREFGQAAKGVVVHRSDSGVRSTRKHGTGSSRAHGRSARGSSR